MICKKCGLEVTPRKGSNSGRIIYTANDYVAGDSKTSQSNPYCRGGSGAGFHEPNHMPDLTDTEAVAAWLTS